MNTPTAVLDASFESQLASSQGMKSFFLTRICSHAEFVRDPVYHRGQGQG